MPVEVKKPSFYARFRADKEKIEISWIRPNYLLVSSILFFTISYSLILLMDQETIYLLTEEDGLFELLSAIFFLLSSVFFLACFLTKKIPAKFLMFNTNKNYFYLLLAIVFFFGFGEEISWGQRIIGFDTPSALTDVNMQQEFNLHNLSIFHGSDSTGERKSFWLLFLTIDRMFSVFWLVYCFIIPLLMKVSLAVTRRVEHLCLPTVPLWLGVFFPLNYLASRAMAMIYASPAFTQIILIEIKEAGFAFLFLQASIYMLQHNYTSKSEVKI